MSEQQVKIEEQKEVYAYDDSEYQKFEMRRLEYSNALIGKFTDKGEYKITTEVLKEFVAVLKVIREVHENRYYAIANFEANPSLNIKFSVVVKSVDEDKKAATLCLLEDVISPNTGAYSLRSTPIATYKDDDDAFFSIKMKKAFNLKTIDEQETNDTFNEKFAPNYYKIKTEKLKLKKALETYEEGIEEGYVKELLAELKKMGPQGEWVLKRFVRHREAMGEKFPIKGSKNYYKECARLLDQILTNAKDIPFTKEQIAIINKIQNHRVQQVKNATEPDLIVAVPKPTGGSKPKSASKDGGGSGSGGKKGGGGSKSGKKEDSKPKKKEDKKPVKIPGVPAQILDATISKSASEKHVEQKSNEVDKEVKNSLLDMAEWAKYSSTEFALKEMANIGKTSKRLKEESSDGGLANLVEEIKVIQEEIGVTVVQKDDGRGL